MKLQFYEPIHMVNVSLNVSLNRPTQLLFATGIEGGIHDRQVLKYQPSVTSRLIFQYLMIVNGIKG